MADREEFDMHEDRPVDGLDRRSDGISRRNLVMAGAAAAWTVPLIQIVAAAPAHAATSGGAAVLVVRGATGDYNDDGSALSVSVTVENDGPAPTQDLQVTLSFPNGWAPSGATVTGWATSRQGSTWTFTAISQLSAKGGSSTLEASFSIKKIDRNKAVNVTGAATAVGSNPAPILISVQ